MEESVFRNIVATPYGVEKFGSTLNLRKINTVTNQSLASSTTPIHSNLTYTTNTETDITVASVANYAAVELPRDTLNQVIDSANLVTAYRRQMLSALDEAIDTTIANLASGLSQSVTSADITDDMLRKGVGLLAKYAKRKFQVGQTASYLVLHPDEIANAMGCDSVKSYLIRGNAGAAATGDLASTYGIQLRESGLVQTSGGTTAYCPLILPDAFALAFNEQPHILDVQRDGLLDRYVVYTEYGASEWFDTSGVVFVCTIP